MVDLGGRSTVSSKPIWVTVSSRQPELQSKIISERKLKQFVLNQIDFKSTAIVLVNVQNTLNSIFFKKKHILYKLPVNKRTNFRKISSSEPRKIELLNQIFFPKQMIFHTLINTNSKIHSNFSQFIMFWQLPIQIVKYYGLYFAIF